MSEYQVYKFKTVDRALTREERKTISSWSSRTSAGSSSATFTYSYGDFPKSPKQVLKDYFDVFLYFSNWGTKRLMLKFPLSLIDYKAIEPFDIGEDIDGSAELEFILIGGDLIMDFELNKEEGGGWFEEDDFEMADFVAIREAILNGDYSALYLYWLKAMEMQDNEYYGEDEDEDDEYYDDVEFDAPKSPPIPPQLKNISASLQHFIDFFEIDKDTVKAAQSLSKELKEANEAPKDYQKLIKNLSDEDKDRYLEHLLNDEPRLSLTFKKYLDSFSKKTATNQSNVSFSKILSKKAEEKDNRLETERTITQRKHLERMAKLERNEVNSWKSVHFNLNRKTGKSYDLAVEALKELKELAKYKNELEIFNLKMKQIRIDYKRSSSLKGRFDKAGL
jgi:flagellar basal body rod protein FlgB